METLELRIADHEHIVFQMDAPNVEGYVIGRADGTALYEPDISLSEVQARELGVSRRHAALVRYRGGVHVVDLNSVNGTFLNNEILKPNLPYSIKKGDEISLGKLTLIVTQLGK